METRSRDVHWTNAAGMDIQTPRNPWRVHIVNRMHGIVLHKKIFPTTVKPKTTTTLETLRQSKCAHLNPHLFDAPVKPSTPAGKIVAKHFKTKSAAKDFIGLFLLGHCQANGLKLIQEHPFHPVRKWRFDWAIPQLMIAVEFDGGIMDRNGSHTSVGRIKTDTEKINTAQQMGWTVYRFHALNYKTISNHFPSGNKSNTNKKSTPTNETKTDFIFHADGSGNPGRPQKANQAHARIERRE